MRGAASSRPTGANHPLARRARSRHRLVALAVLLSIAAVASLAYWDAQRDSAAALSDLAREQVSVAKGVAAALTIDPGAARAEQALLANFRAVERDRSLRLFLLKPDADRLIGTDDLSIISEPVSSAVAAGLESVRLGREEAAALGLPHRTALVGLAAVSGGPMSGWRVVAAGSAFRERDRERWAYRRLVLSVLTSGGLVLAFGAFVLRSQRKELELERELAISAAREQQNDRLERASRVATMGTLAMGVAHEISTPLGVIAGRAEQILPRVAGDERSGAAVRAILEQTQRINQIIRGLLGLARGDWLSAKGISPSAVGREAAAMVSHRFAKAGVALELDAGEGLPDVPGDASLLENALVNLLLNACDACESGGHVRLRVSADGKAVRFLVTDDGAGISSSDAGKVFEPLFTTKPSGAGTGLGLAIANEIVKSHRGTLTLVSAFPRGTEACIEIPLPSETEVSA
jgi:signal transduction histidine kinase